MNVTVRRWTHRTIMAFAILVALPTLATPGDWGVLGYDEELPRYTAEVAKREEQFRKQQAELTDSRREAEDFLGSFLMPGTARPRPRSRSFLPTVLGP